MEHKAVGNSLPDSQDQAATIGASSDDCHLVIPEDKRKAIGITDIISYLTKKFRQGTEASAASSTGPHESKMVSARKSKETRPLRLRLSARDRDMMEFSPPGDLKGVRHEDGKGLGGCRMQ